MTEIDWSQHTPHEIRVALEKAPKVAGPWRSATYEGRRAVEDWRRRGRGTGCFEHESDVAQVWYFADDDGAKPTYDAPGVGIEHCASVEDGKSKADAALRAAGWLLDDEG